MRATTIDGSRLVLPSVDDWELLYTGKVQDIEGVPVLSADILRSSMAYALHRDAVETDKVLSFMTTAPYDKPRHLRRQWRPVMLFWPQGHPDLASLSLPTQDHNVPLRVYFHRFHCFDCSLDVDGFALDQNAYLPEELRSTWELAHPLIKRCPRCGGDLRCPGLLDIYHVFA